MSSEAARYFPGVFENGKTESRPVDDSSPTKGVPESKSLQLDHSDLTITLQTPINGAGCSEVPDEILLAQICEGDKEALTGLFRRFARVVHAVAFRILRDTAEAEDLLQDVFLFIFRKCAIFDSSKSSARSWIVQMTYHRAIDRRRYLQSRHYYAQVEIDEEAAQIPDSRSRTACYDDSIEAIFGTKTSQRIFESLSVDQRETIRLVFFDGYTFEEIAAKLGQSLGNVRNHYYRGLERIRQQVFSNRLRGH